MATLATQYVAPPRMKRAQSRPVRNRRFGGTSDPILDDLLTAATALALTLATDGVKQLAYAGQISGQRASAWKREGKGNPLHDLTLISYRLLQIGQRPFHLIAHLMATVKQAMLGISDDELVRRFWTLTDEECAAECAENLAVSRFQRDGNLKELERADQEEAERQLDRVAVCREMRRRSIDPRDARWK